MTNRQMLAMQDKFLVHKFFFIFNVCAQYYLLQFAVLSKPSCLQKTNSISAHLLGLIKTVFGDDACGDEIRMMVHKNWFLNDIKI